MIRHLIYGLLHICLLNSLLQPVVASDTAEKKDYFRDWFANCRYQPSVMCHASTYVDLQTDDKFQYQLSIAQATLHSPLDITFISTYQLADVSEPIYIHVDDEKPMKLWPDADYRTTTAINAYQIIDQRIASALIPKMKQGHRLYITFLNKHGEQQQTSFSLLGFTAALTFIHALHDYYDTSQPKTKWVDKIARYYPAIQACLNKNNGNGLITSLQNTAPFQLTITLGQPQQYYNCQISADGKRLFSFDPVPTTANDYLFSIEPDAITDTCYHTEKYLDGHKQTLGYLYIKRCK